MNKVVKACDDALGLGEKERQETEMLEARTDFLKVEFYPPSWKMSTGFNFKIVFCKVPDVKNDICSLVDVMNRSNFNLYANIQHNVDQLLLKLTKRLERIFSRDTVAMPQGVLDTICNAAESVQKSFVDATDVGDMK